MLIIPNYGGADGHIDPFGASLTCHGDDCPACRASHQAVIHNKDVLVLKLRFDDAELAAYAFLSTFLIGHDEGFENCTCSG